MRVSAGLGVLCWIFGATCPAAEGDVLRPLREMGLVDDGAQWKVVEGGFRFTEGPAGLSDGSIVFTDQPNNRMVRWSADSGVSELQNPAGRANGLAVGPGDRIFACTEESNSLSEYLADGSSRVVATGYQGNPFNGPNDVWRHPGGALYLTDPFYPRPWSKDRTPPQDVRGIYRVDLDGTVTLLDWSLVQPNGIVGTPDGRTLYVSDIADGKTYRFPIQSDGSLGPKELFCAIGSDGMTLDAKGNLYLTGKPGVTLVGPDGGVIGTIPIPEPWTANVAFAGAEGRTLVITASTRVYLLPMRVGGGR